MSLVIKNMGDNNKEVKLSLEYDGYDNNVLLVAYSVTLKQTVAIIYSDNTIRFIDNSLIDVLR